MNNEHYTSSFLVPDFVDIQRKSFFHLLERGVLEEFSKVNPIVSDISQLKLTFYPQKFLLILPDFSVSEAILQGKTYSCKLYMPATLSSQTGGSIHGDGFWKKGVRSYQGPRGGKEKPVVTPSVTPTGEIRFPQRIERRPHHFVNHINVDTVLQPQNTYVTDRTPLKAGDGQRTPSRGGGVGGPAQMRLRGRRSTPRNEASPSSFRPFNGHTSPITSFQDGASVGSDNLFWVLLGNLPLMTKRGHFIINGSPRVLVNQLTRCPGIYFHERRWGTDKRIVYADFVSRRGAWLRLQTDKAGAVWARLKRVPKIPFSLFYESMIVCERDPSQWTTSDKATLIEMYQEVNPTKREASAQSGKAFLHQKFKNPRTYDLGSTGRDQLNMRFGGSVTSQQLTSKDLYYAFEHIKELHNHRTFADDIDNLKNRRVRAAGDLVQGQLETGLYRLEKAVVAKMRNPSTNISCKTVLTTKPLDGALREFFGSSPLSQYMDQTNPLAEITQKRRISSLGPGGISRETAGMAIRGIHPTHYGRICPIETPEGKNAGLVNSLTVFTQIQKDGILESPYYAILQGQVQNELGFTFLPVNTEEQHSVRIAPGDVNITASRFLPSRSFPIREAGNPQEDFRQASRETVSYMAVSPIQMISIATSLIPFLEHDDANRALMGSNMQRQAVPLLRAERPIVGTGLEALVIASSGHALQSNASGYVSFVSNERVIISNFRIPCEGPLGSGVCFARKTLEKPLGSGPLTRTQWPLRFCTESNTKLRPKAGSSSFKNHFSFTNKHLMFCEQNIHRFKNRSTQETDKRLQLLTHRASKGNGRENEAISLQANWWLGPSHSSSHHFLKKSEMKAGGGRMFCEQLDSLKNVKGHPPALCLYNITYSLQSYCRSNQETCLNHVPAVIEGEWVQEGDLIADCSASQLGELSLGKNILIAYLPWEGYNFEDAVVISERLVLEDVYTSIHVQKYEVETRETKFGFERITREVPGLLDWQQAHLDKYGIARIGSWVKEGDILIGKVSPKGLHPLSPYERLAYDIANVEAATLEDTSLRVPKGVEGRVINYHVFEASWGQGGGRESIVGALLRGAPHKNPIDSAQNLKAPPRRVRVYLAEERRIQVGDKVAGRHGNKGIVSTILPRQDMPYLPDGQIVDLVLNPLGIPSRMNVGQVFECLLGLAGMQLGQHFQVTPFDEVYGAEASRSLVYLKLYQARLRANQNWVFDFKFPGKVGLFNGRTGHLFDQWVTVGYAYMLKLVHLVDEKIHARSTGPYSLVTKQPLGGRSKHGGQRLGEMEVWALEGFGAAYILQEMLTSKSDDVLGREQAVNAIIFKGKMSLGNPEAFKVLVRELQSLCLDVGVYAISPNRLHREVIDVGNIL